MGTIRNLIRPNGQYMGQNDKREMQYGLPEFGNQTFIFPHNRWHACWHCGYSPPPILRVGGGVTPLLIYDAHSGRGFGRGQNMAARNLKPKGKKTL